MKPVARYTLTLHVPIVGNDPRAVRRLRAALKCLGRAFQIRAVEVKPVENQTCPDSMEPKS